MKQSKEEEEEVAMVILAINKRSKVKKKSV